MRGAPGEICIVNTDINIDVSVTLLLEQPDIINKPVSFFVHRGYFHPQDARDIQQEVRLQLIEKWSEYISQYKHKAKLTTYLTGIVINLCRNIARGNKYNAKTMLSLDGHDITEPSKHSKMHFADEFKKIERFLILIGKLRFKFIFFLKFKYALPLNEKDIVAFIPNVKHENIIEFIELSKLPPEERTQKIVFSRLTVLLSTYDNKINTDDAIRKWIDLKINELIMFMNGDPKTANYDSETIQILLEYYFSSSL